MQHEKAIARKMRACSAELTAEPRAYITVAVYRAIGVIVSVLLHGVPALTSRAASVQLDGERRRLAQQVELKALSLVDRQASVRAQASC